MQRKYRITDNQMIINIEYIQALLKEYSALFYDFDKEFSEDFISDWSKIINECKAELKDVNVRSDQAELTKKINAKIDEVRFVYQCIRYFLEKAYKDDSSKLNEFGFYQYGKIGGSINAFVKFLAILDSGLDKNYGELVLYGCPKEEIKKIGELRVEIDQLYNERNLLKNSRKSSTHRRIKMLNECFEYSVKIKKAAKVIFRRDEKTLDKFLKI